ncbi:MAG: alpha/beta hydrolase [Methanomicrobiales archaeon]|nr:alpha/beta hydrolase [Methanomicrobiales archaeon]
MKHPLADDLLLVEGESSFLLIGRAGSGFPLYIESCEREYCEAVHPDDLVVVSAPEGGAIEPAAMLLTLIRRYHLPLVILPKEHPGSSRLKLVVAVGPEIQLSCGIRRGTHPEQHLLCSSDELSGIRLGGEEGAVVLENTPPHIRIRRLDGGGLRTA